MPEDALSTEPTQHDYKDLMRLEAPHEVVVNPEFEPGRPDVPRGVVEDQLDRLNTGEAPVDGTTGIEPGGGGDVVTVDATSDPDGGGTSEFNPGDHTVPEVTAYLVALPDDDSGHAERERVLAAERAGQARKGILEA